MNYIRAFEAWCAEENTRLARIGPFDLVIELRRGPDGKYVQERTRQFLDCWLAAQRTRPADPLDRTGIKGAAR